jgi:hypothetical protein
MNWHGLAAACKGTCVEVSLPLSKLFVDSSPFRCLFSILYPHHVWPFWWGSDDQSLDFLSLRKSTPGFEWIQSYHPQPLWNRFSPDNPRFSPRGPVYKEWHAQLRPVKGDALRFQNWFKMAEFTAYCHVPISLLWDLWASTLEWSSKWQRMMELLAPVSP